MQEDPNPWFAVAAAAAKQQTVEKWNLFCQDVKVRGKLPIQFFAGFVNGQPTIFAKLIAWDITKPEPRDTYDCFFGKHELYVETHDTIHDGEEPSESALYVLAKRLYLHELNEWFEVEGVHTRNPHKKG